MDSQLSLKLNAAGALISSAVYVSGLILAGLMTGDKIVVALALATAGVGFLGYACDLFKRLRWLALVLCLTSNICGVIAGLALLKRYFL